MSDEQKQEPVAWAVMVRWEYRDICATFAEAKRRADAITYWEGDEQRTARVRPLYSPAPAALTDEERATIKEAADSYDDGCNERCREITKILRGLLERTK